MAQVPVVVKRAGRQLLDMFGRGVRKRDIERPFAAPRMDGGRPVVSSVPAAGMTPLRLARIHRAAAEGDPLAFFELAEDIEERDLHYLGIISTRKRSVAQLPITVTSPSDAADHKRHTEFLQSWVDDGVLRASLFDMMDAVGKGISFLEIDFQYRSGHLLPREFIYRPQRWFTFDDKDGETPLMRDGAHGVELPDHKFVVHRHAAKSGLTIRSGLTRVASWAWMFKSFTANDWATFCQNYGMPIRLGRFGTNATEEQKDILRRAVYDVAGDCAAIVPQGMEIEFAEVGGKGTSTELYERRCDWLDRQMSKAVLGQTTTTDAISGGHAVSREHRQVQEDIERADAMALTATINKQVVPNLIAFNFGPQQVYPKLHIGRPDEVPLAEFADAFAKVASHGATVPAAWLRGRLGAPAPEGDEEIVGGRQEEQPADGAASVRDLSMFAGLRDHHNRSAVPVDRQMARLSRDAAGALGGLQADIRKELMLAKDLEDAANRISKLDLNTDELAIAMSRALALAHMAGQASVVDELEERS
ncbi:MAG: DUF935 domain-containing protein [Ahrensia sp.]|nr:DUF935 domain-containing protein [Ahrensia sp.]